MDTIAVPPGTVPDLVGSLRVDSDAHAARPPATSAPAVTIELNLFNRPPSVLACDPLAVQICSSDNYLSSLPAVQQQALGVEEEPAGSDQRATGT
jgi:hypothetical protein